MKMRNTGLLVCAVMLTLVSACAQAGSFAGRWVGMKYGDVLTIKQTTVDRYLGKTQQGVPLYLTEVGGTLLGDVLHVATAKVTIRFDRDANHLLVTIPTMSTQEYRRASR